MILYLQQTPENDGIERQYLTNLIMSIFLQLELKLFLKMSERYVLKVLNDFFFNTALSAQLSCLAGLSLSLSKMGLCTLYSVQCTDCYENFLQF